MNEQSKTINPNAPQNPAAHLYGDVRATDKDNDYRDRITTAIFGHPLPIKGGTYHVINGKLVEKPFVPANYRAQPGYVAQPTALDSEHVAATEAARAAAAAAK